MQQWTETVSRKYQMFIKSILKSLNAGARQVSLMIAFHESHAISQSSLLHRGSELPFSIHTCAHIHKLFGLQFLCDKGSAPLLGTHCIQTQRNAHFSWLLCSLRFCISYSKYASTDCSTWLTSSPTRGYLDGPGKIFFEEHQRNFRAIVRQEDWTKHSTANHFACFTNRRVWSFHEDIKNQAQVKGDFTFLFSMTLTPDVWGASGFPSFV